MVDPIRRKLLKTGAAVAAMAATPSVFAQQTGNGESGRFYQKGHVRIRYEETGSGFPLLLIAGGGLSGSTIERLCPGQSALRQGEGAHKGPSVNLGRPLMAGRLQPASAILDELRRHR